MPAAQRHAQQLLLQLRAHQPRLLAAAAAAGVASSSGATAAGAHRAASGVASMRTAVGGLVRRLAAGTRVAGSGGGCQPLGRAAGESAAASCSGSSGSSSSAAAAAAARAWERLPSQVWWPLEAAGVGPSSARLQQARGAAGGGGQRVRQQLQRLWQQQQQAMQRLAQPQQMLPRLRTAGSQSNNSSRGGAAAAAATRAYNCSAVLQHQATGSAGGGSSRVGGAALLVWDSLSLWWASGAAAAPAATAALLGSGAGHCSRAAYAAYAYVTTSVLSALNTVGGHLPKLLGLALAEMVRCSPLLGGAAADAAPQWETVLERPTFVAGSGGSSGGSVWFGASGAGGHAGLAGLLTVAGLWSRAMAAGHALRAAADSLAAALRVAWLLLLFSPVVATAPLALQWELLSRQRWMVLLRTTLETAGPAFIKWGQWAATRHDLFPPDMCEELEALHTAAPAHAWRHTDATLSRAFGLPADELFEWVEEVPLASGSIGQVHRARLSAKGAAVTGCTPGSLVAIKVRHPGVGDAIERDFAAMMWAAHAAAALAPKALVDLRLEDTLKQFAAPLHEQVDLSREARNLFRFCNNFRHTRAVSFPTPLYPLVAPDVLVESFEPGRGISDYIADARHPYSHRLAELGSGTMLQMMLVDNLIHSDLHPGNILVRLEAPRGLVGLAHAGLRRLAQARSLSPGLRQRLNTLQAAWLQPRIILLDVGMATELTPPDQENMLGLFKAFAALDGRSAAEWVLRFSGDEQTCPNPELFKEEMDATFAHLRASQRGGWDGTHFDSGADALAGVLEHVRTHHVALPGHICAVVVTTLVLEGWSNKLDPNHSVLSQVQGMFEPANLNWRERLANAVDHVMDRGENWVALDV